MQPISVYAGDSGLDERERQMLPFSNPVSTAFCLQALALWDDHQAGRWSFELPQLI